MTLATAIRPAISTPDTTQYKTVVQTNKNDSDPAARTWEMGMAPAGVEPTENEKLIHAATNPLNDVLVELETESEDESTASKIAASDTQLASNAAEKLHSDLPHIAEDSSRKGPSTCDKINRGIDIAAAVNCGIGIVGGLGLVGVAVTLIVNQPDMGRKDPGQTDITTGFFVAGAAITACCTCSLVMWLKAVVLK